LAAWRQQCPTLTVRSTFIVGFPGETEQDFEQLLQFLSAAQLDRVGCFAYSPVAGAPANALDDAVPEPLKQERLARLMALQAQISRDKLQARIGEKILVLVDEVDEQSVTARSTADAPEIDGHVIIDGAWELDPGDFIEVEITAADEHDLHAIPIGE
jgi:ribosomal protein S12 methylthiotransferase